MTHQMTHPQSKGDGLHWDLDPVLRGSARQARRRGISRGRVRLFDALSDGRRRRYLLLFPCFGPEFGKPEGFTTLCCACILLVPR